MTRAFDSRSGQGRIEAARGRGLVDGTVHYTGCVGKLNIQSPNSRFKKIKTGRAENNEYDFGCIK